MTLTFDLTTFTVLVHWLSRDQTMYQFLEKQKFAAEFTASILHTGLSRQHLQSQILLPDHMAEFKLFEFKFTFYCCNI